MKKQQGYMTLIEIMIIFVVLTTLVIAFSAPSRKEHQPGGVNAAESSEVQEVGESK